MRANEPDLHRAEDAIKDCVGRTSAGDRSDLSMLWDGLLTAGRRANSRAKRGRRRDEIQAALHRRLLMDNYVLQ